MDRMLYVAMTGASQVLESSAVNNNNLANANKVGFRQDLELFRGMEAVRDGAMPSRVYSTLAQTGVDFSSGPMIPTGRDLDVALTGSGYLAVQTPDGRTAYTREGALSVTEAGQLVTSGGLPVLGNGGPIAIPPAEKIEIGVDGSVSVKPVGEGADAMVVVDRLRLVKGPDEIMVKGLDGLLHTKDGSQLETDPQVRLRAGALEGSNVNPMTAMVSMIELAREYEWNIKAMNTANDLARSENEILKVV